MIFAISVFFFALSDPFNNKIENAVKVFSFTSNAHPRDCSVNQNVMNHHICFCCANGGKIASETFARKLITSKTLSRASVCVCETQFPPFRIELSTNLTKTMKPQFDGIDG